MDFRLFAIWHQYHEQHTAAGGMRPCPSVFSSVRLLSNESVSLSLSRWLSGFVAFVHAARRRAAAEPLSCLLNAAAIEYDASRTRSYKATKRSMYDQECRHFGDDGVSDPTRNGHCRPRCMGTEKGESYITLNARFSILKAAIGRVLGRVNAKLGVSTCRMAGYATTRIRNNSQFYRVKCAQY